MKGICRTTVLSVIMMTHLLTVSEQVDKATNSFDVVLSAKLLKVTPSSLELELTMENRSDVEVYVASKPRSLTGEEGPYVEAGSDHSLISLATRVYPDPTSFVYSDHTSVELRRLLPGEKHREIFKLESPIRETYPPFVGGFSVVKKRVSVEKVKRIVASVGYFRGREAGDVANRRVRGSTLVRLPDGSHSTLLLLQNLVSTEVGIP